MGWIPSWDRPVFVLLSGFGEVDGLRYYLACWFQAPWTKRPGLEAGHREGSDGSGSEGKPGAGGPDLEGVVVARLVRA